MPNFYADAYMVKAISSIFPSIKGKKVFEFGCGAGSLLNFLKHQGAKVCGIHNSEIPEEFFKALKLNVLRKDATWGFVDSLPEKEFDLTLSSNFFSKNMFSPEQARRILENIKRLTKPGGYSIHLTHFATKLPLSLEEIKKAGFKLIAEKRSPAIRGQDFSQTVIILQRI
ncbi:MAG: class I SAM-dependent methyltransferase [Candidatus Diapherotrites archaeon]|nr:class I SAM-dependent methyltransferase [Candidatus Diapherotrites archaeon]